jgi:cell division protein FtsN
MASTRPLTRDYKRSRQNQPDLARFKQFGLGLGIGLLVALAVFGWQRNAMQQLLREQAAVPRPEPRATAGEAEPATDVPSDAPAAAQYDFYEMLEKFEVVVPEKERDTRPKNLLPAAITRPGTYVLQAGVFRNAEDAQRIRQQLAVLGVTASVQRIAVDNDVRHRVRIGPLDNLEEVNAVRRKLQGADIESIVIRVAD